MAASYNKYEYRRASHEKFNAASSAHEAGHFAVSHYLSGVAVECMLRAYRWAIDPSWDEKHNLRELMKKCGVMGRLERNKQPLVRDALVEIARRWSVSHRYAPEDRLAAYLKEIGLGNGKRVLTDNSEFMVKTAEVILRECDRRCP